MRKKFLRKTPIWMGKYDTNTGLINIGKQRFVIYKSGDINPEFNMGNRILFFIDSNTRTTVGNSEYKGKLISPKLANKLNAHLKNYLNFLTEESFWGALLSKMKKDKLIMLLCVILGLFAGMFLARTLIANGVKL